MSVRPKDVERVSSVVEGRVPSKTGTAQMQSPEVDSATQLDEMLFPAVVSLLRLAYALLMWSSGLCPSDTVLWLVPFSCSYGISWWNSILVRESCDSQFIQSKYSDLSVIGELCDSLFVQNVCSEVCYLRINVILNVFRVGPFLSHMKVPPNVYVGFIKIRTRGAKVELGCLYKESVTAPESQLKLPRQNSIRHSIPSEDAAAGPSTSFNAMGLQLQRSSDMKYQIGGWVILAAEYCGFGGL
ncbi:hypothetical protein Tco_0397433 [Tanacetum coccineum]